MSAATPKGKGKADEPRPLLDETASSIDDTLLGSEAGQLAENPHVSTSSHLSLRRRTWRSYTWTAVLAFLTLFFGFMLSLILLADSYAAPALRNVNKALSHSGRGGDKFWKEALVVRGPDAVRITGVGRKPDESGDMRLEVNMTVAMRIAVDTDFIMGFRKHHAQDDPWWRKKWKALGRWTVRQLGDTTAVVDEVVIYPSPSMNLSQPLITVRPLSPIAIPLLPGLSIEDHNNPPSSLESVSIPLTTYPSQNASLLFKFFKQSWAQGFVSVRVHGSNFMIHEGDERSDPPEWWQLTRWKNWLKLDKENIVLDLTLPIPPFHIPSHPPSSPGSDLPKLSELLVLESFNITSAPSIPSPPRPVPSSTGQLIVDTSDVGARHDQNVLAYQGIPTGEFLSLSLQHVPTGWSILIFALASIAHPFAAFAPKLNLGHAFPPLPFIVSLPVPLEEDDQPGPTGQTQNEVIPVAKVYALPEFNATHIRIPLSGYLLPLSNSSVRLPDAISAFVSSYLSYKPSSISISSPLYPSMEVHALFPPPSHRLELLRDVSIENMSIHPGLGSVSLPDPGQDTSSSPWTKGVQTMDILATATVHARVVLPRGMDIDIRVVRVWVDCFVFDGEVPPEAPPLHVKRVHHPSDRPSRVVRTPPKVEDPPLPEPLPLPTPLPLRAFGRITPRTWLNATSSSAPRLGPIAVDNTQDEATGEGNTGTSVYVTAELVDVPLEVLPGRQGDLSRFVTKVLFSKEPVVAGIRGIAAVGVSVPGLTIPASSGPRVEGNELILTGLPFEGNVIVGGRNFLNLNL